MTDWEIIHRENLTVHSINTLHDEIIENKMNNPKEVLIRQAYILRGYLEISFLLGIITREYRDRIAKEVSLKLKNT